MGDAAKKLFDEVIKLSAEERREFALQVLASVGEDDVSQPSRTQRVGAASWETIDSLRGVVHLGGNAVDDCNGLYDG
ncbi:MAG: hypothetical protein JNK72_02780 [Myxococcales bacterium]|nr:hypothetical protein [Myxococcales bacterium]